MRAVSPLNAAAFARSRRRQSTSRVCIRVGFSLFAADVHAALLLNVRRAHDRVLCCVCCGMYPLAFRIMPSEATSDDSHFFLPKQRGCPCALVHLSGAPPLTVTSTCSAAPATEVAKAAPELLRTLIYSPPPEWASEQTPPSDAMHPDRRRLGSLAAVLAAAPQAAPGAAISHIFSEGVDVSQRLLVLDGLRAAAHELAGRPLLPPLSAIPGAASHHASAGDAPLQDVAPDLL